MRKWLQLLIDLIILLLNLCSCFIGKKLRNTWKQLSSKMLATLGISNFQLLKANHLTTWIHDLASNQQCCWKTVCFLLFVVVRHGMESPHNAIHLLSQTVEEWQRFKTRLSTYQHCTVPELSALSASLAGFIYSKEHDVLSCSDCSLKVTDITTHHDFIALHMATDSAQRCSFLNWYRENLYRGEGKSILHKYIYCYMFCFIFLIIIIKCIVRSRASLRWEQALQDLFLDSCLQLQYIDY